jgi:hypothetical protein
MSSSQLHCCCRLRRQCYPLPRSVFSADKSRGDNALTGALGKRSEDTVEKGLPLVLVTPKEMSRLSIAVRLSAHWPIRHIENHIARHTKEPKHDAPTRGDDSCGLG